MATLKSFLKKKKYLPVSLTLTSTHHLEVLANINGVSGRFILDTGASNSCVGMDKIEHFKLISKASEVKAAGAGATDMETQLSTKNTLEIGHWKKKKIKIILFDLQHINEALTSHEALPVDGIIGADVLEKGQAVIDYKTSTLYLKKKKRSK
jgi:predicted aspartyl protease